jgi:uncharacterized protein YndB with AHSA1/START domain
VSISEVEAELHDVAVGHHVVLASIRALPTERLDTCPYRNMFSVQLNDKETAVTSNRHGSAVIEFPSELEIVFTRSFDAPIALVFDVLTKPEHVSKWGATPPDQMTECSIDLRVGGNYRSSFVTEDGTVCSFRGTYLEVEPPIRTVATWLFEGWPDADAVETMQLHEIDGVTTLTMTLAFRDKAGRDHMTRFDGQQASFDEVEDILRSLLDLKETVSQ